MADHPWPERGGGFIGDLIGDPNFRPARHAVRRPARRRLRLPAADGLPDLRDVRADGPLAGRGVEGSRGGAATFRQVTLPIILPGLITGSILVLILMMGEYVIPQILGYGRVYLIGNALVNEFLTARD